MRAIITVLGGDKVGIIYNVTKIVSEFNVNILDISQTIMSNQIFTMLMLVDTDKMVGEHKDFVTKLEAFGEEAGVSIRVQMEEVFNAMHSI